METYFKYEEGSSGDIYHVMVDWSNGNCEVIDIRQENDDGDIIGKNLVSILADDFILSIELYAEQYLNQYEYD